jgi:uncharacterized membrane protein
VSKPSNRLLTAIIVIAVIGLADAAYLTYVHYHGFSALVCAGSSHGHSSCETVQSSVWSKVAGIPVALLGLIGYLMLLGSLFVRGELGRATGFMVALIGFGFSAYLTFREAVSLHGTYCEWCLGSATCLTVLMVLTGIRFLRGAPVASA